MEEFGSTMFDIISTAARRKRSQASRRPRPESQALVEGHDPSPSSSTAPSDDVSKISSDETAGCDTNTKRKEFNLNQCLYREEYAAGNEGENMYKKSKRFGDVEVGFAPTDSKSTSKMIYQQESKSRSTSFYSEVNSEYPTFGKSRVFVDGFGGDDNTVKKVKLKVCGVTRTIQANTIYNGVSGSESSAKSSRASDSNRRQLKEVMLDNNNLPGDRKSTLQGIPWKDFSRVSFSVGRENSMTGKMSRKNFGKECDKSESVRKSKRVPKKRLLDEDFGDDEEDDEIRYLEKLKTSKAAAVYKEDDDEDFSKKLRKLSNVSNTEMAGGKKSRSDKVSEETEYEEEEDSASDIDVKVVKKKQRKESVESVMNSKREMTLTTRQRALQSSRDTSFAPGGSLIEFPNGLPPAPPRKLKEKLSEVDQHLKKVEAAQKRRMQVEKAARESEAEAIRKILGQDSSRKKREEKLRKRQEELAQEKAANAQKLASNTIRWVFGPTGTVVTFPSEMGLPSILEFNACSYPPPRENCVGPLCGNPYKYRDSKSKLPLCSLHCYKAIQGKMLAETTC